VIEMLVRLFALNGNYLEKSINLKIASFSAKPMKFLNGWIPDGLMAYA